jgi:DNA modification methylase
LITKYLDQIICGDCVDVLKTFPDNCINLTVTSPLYGDLRDYNGYTFDFPSIAQELFRVTIPGGVVVWVEADTTINGSESGDSFRHALTFKDLGFRLHDTMIYQKNAIAFPQTTRYYSCFEFMFVLSKGRPRVFNLIRDRENKQAGKKITGHSRQSDNSLKEMWGTKKGKCIHNIGIRWNVWTYNTGWGHTYKEKYLKQHPAIFPEQLAADHIISWSNCGDIVLDPMCGSGTTCKMAKLNNRHFIGIDCSEDYCDISRVRTALVN